MVTIPVLSASAFQSVESWTPFISPGLFYQGCPETQAVNTLAVAGVWVGLSGNRQWRRKKGQLHSQ